ERLRASKRYRNDAAAFLKDVDAEGAEKPSAARGGQDVIRTGAVVADRLRAVMAEEDRARMPQSRQQRLRVGHRKFEVFRSNMIGDRAGLVETLDPDQRAAPQKRRGNDLLARHRRKLPGDAGANRVKERGVGGKQHRLRHLVVLSLR